VTGQTSSARPTRNGIVEEWAGRSRTFGSGLATDLAGTVMLGLLTTVTALGMGRLFRGASYVGPVVAAALTGHVLSWAGRRLRTPAIVSIVVALAMVFLVTVWVVVLGTTAAGLPTVATLHSLGADLTRARIDFESLRAPVPATPGFLAVSMFAVGSIAVASDWIAFRLGTTLEATLPSFSLFLFTCALGTARGMTIGVIAYLAALLAFVLTREVTKRSYAATWLTSMVPPSRWALARGGPMLAVVAVVGGAIVGPLLPGSRSAALVGYHNGVGSAQRTTISPLVDIGDRLAAQSHTEMFTVRSNAPEYWRLTALDEFDGTIWSSNETYRRSGPALAPETPAPGHGHELEQTVSISNLDSVWLPGAYRPVSVHGVSGVSYDPQSSSLIGPSATSDNTTYDIVSVVSQPSLPELAAAPPVDRSGWVRHYLSLPSIPPLVRSTALRVVRGQSTPYGKALALQDYFRDGQFTYDPSVPRGHDNEAMTQFLTAKRGFCEQFAGTFAVMARVVGLPSRVAVGFTPGQLERDGRYHVFGGDAHAWPEIYMGAQLGWVSFEPTPGRGQPGAQSYTGVAPAQAEITTASTPGVSNPVNQPATPSGAAALASGLSSLAASGSSQAPTTSAAPNPVLLGLAELAALLVLAAALIPLSRRLIRRRRRRRAGGDGAERILVAWGEVSETLALAGAGRRPGETLAEYARRAGGATLAPERSRVLTELARDVALASYSNSTIPPATVARVVADAGRIEETVRKRSPARLRWRWVLDPRPLLAPLEPLPKPPPGVSERL
jgi:transglutaminase-like putative cysteine protease